VIKVTNKIKNVIKRDKKTITTIAREPYPLVVTRGSGDNIWDIEGNKFIDFTSFIGVYTLGVNGNAEIRSAIKTQVDKLMHPAFLDFYAEPPVKFAENIISMMPKGFGKVFFSNSGAEAIEDAIKISKLFTKKSYIIAFYNSFHGRTMGSLGLTSARLAQREHFGPFPNVVHSIYPNVYRSKFNDPEEESKACIDHLERNILGKEYSPKEVAAIFVEPVQGEGGYIIPPKSFIKELRRVATENNIMLVSDEIQSGYMRTGKFLAMDHFGVTADIYTMAKALGGGLPLAATISHASLGNIPPGAHGGTYGGNLVSVAAGIASLNYLKRNKKKLERMVKDKNKIIMKRLNQMKDRYEIVGDVRGLGLMTAAEFVKSKKTKEHAIKEREKILQQCFSNGLILLACGTSTIRLIPPITISKENLEKGLNIFEDAIKSVKV
jgi:4-aminobutyrate aminotransferase